MRFWKNFAAVAVLAIVPSVAMGALAEEPVGKCVKEPGHIPGPFVPDANTARAIFLVVEKAVVFLADAAHFPVVKVQDEGDSWEVFRTRESDEFGGGQLQLKIEKCTGRISQASLSR